MIKIPPQKAATFRRKIFSFYRKHGRMLWFRSTMDLYKITVSEIMLQQTQVERVMEKYPAWIKRWSDWQSLAKASNREVLTMWSGLGYNRRALYLKKLAQAVVKKFNGQLPDDPSILRKLPGIGLYTANAILIFAFNERLAAVDTNVRKVILHEFNLPPTTSAKEIEAIAFQLLPRRNVKDWHHALMDYARLALPAKGQGIRARNSQSRFEGSQRQIRGAIIRQLTLKNCLSLDAVTQSLKRSKADVRAAVLSLQRDGMVTVRGNIIRLV